MELPPTYIKSKEEDIKAEKPSVKEWLGEFLDIDKINPKIIKRLELLNAMTNIIEEEKDSLELAKRLFAYYENEKPDKAFTEEEKEEAIVGLILADIGKSGPPNATEAEQAVVIKLYGIKGIKDTKIPIRSFIERRYSEEGIEDPEFARDDVECLKNMRIDPNMSIEKFWRLHSGWTLTLIEGDGVPEEDLPGAVLHHVLEGDNIDLIDEHGYFKTLHLDGKEKLRFGKNRIFDRPEKLVPLLDKYAAYLERSDNMTHVDAINLLRKLLSATDRFRNDPEFIELIDDMDKVLTPDELEN